MNSLWFIISCFATHRISLMISKEDGPAWIFRKLRRIPKPKTSLKKGLSCEWCMSVYASALICFLLHYTIQQSIYEWIISWLAISSGAIVINQSFTK